MNPGRPAGPHELLQLAEVATAHYVHGRSQRDIAVSLGLSTFAVARMLKRARTEGLVHIDVSLPGEAPLEHYPAHQAPDAPTDAGALAGPVAGRHGH